MTITVNPTELLDLLGENGERWVQGDWDDGERMCLHGAIRRCSLQPGDAFLIQQVADRFGWGIDWNDNDDTDWGMVRSRIMAGIEVTDEMLADTFGPQWLEIVALVRRAAILTDDEVNQFSAARDAWDARGAAWFDDRDAARGAAWFDDRDAALDAAWDAARGAAWIAAWDAARFAASFAAWDAARDAAAALVVRDLIDCEGFTQQHYDVLTGPWVNVIGPVHPDDEGRRG